MKKFTFVITSRNNEKTLKECIDSCVCANSDILIADFSSSDDSLKIAENSGFKTLKMAFYNDYSKLKNELILECDTEWMFFINANEIFIKNTNTILDFVEKNHCAKINLMQEKIVTKPIRIINKQCKFTNPVYEYVINDAKQSEIYLKSHTIQRFDENLNIIKKWMKEKPFSAQTHYYLSCLYLSNNKFQDFIRTSKYYLFLEKNKNTSYYMTKYYLAMTYAYVEKNYQEASKILFEIILEKPLMAEFWCLLGDIYYSLDKYEKSYHFYENAMILGSRRLKEDDLPFHIEKYKKHPQDMMLNCKKIIESSKIYIPNK